MSTPDLLEQRARPTRGNGQEGLVGDLEILRRHWRTVVLVVLASVAVFAIAHESKAKSYTATASVAFQADTLSDAALNISTATSSEPQREADTQVLIAHSAEVAQAVRSQLNVPSATGELLGEVKVEAAPTADVLNLIATTADPRASATLANAFAAQYIAFRARSQLAGISTAQAKIREQVAGLPAKSPERESLEQSLVRLGSLQAIAGGGANIIGRAGVPAAPNGGGLSEAVVIGFLVGLAIAFSLVFLLESLDRRVKTVADFERGYRLPALVGIPRMGSRAVHPDSSALLEPYRILRGALGFTAVTRRLNTLLVTSAVSGEGKTTVAVNLARVVAFSGRRTVLVELDLRRPGAIGPFNLAAPRGVTTAITGAADLEDLLVRPMPTLPNLFVLPSGALPYNPSELLGSPQVADLLSELAADGSMVIIDAPPLNPVADAQVLLDNPAIDACIIVARIDRTKREEMRHARSILDQHRVEPVGVVVSAVRDSSRYGYGYGAYQAEAPALDVDVEAPPIKPGRLRDEEPQAESVNGDENVEALAGRGSRSRPKRTSH